MVLIELVFPRLLARLNISPYVCSNFIALCFSILIHKMERSLSFTVVERVECINMH